MDVYSPVIWSFSLNGLGFDSFWPIPSWLSRSKNQATESMSAQAMCWPRHASDAFPWCSLAAKTSVDWQGELKSGWIPGVTKWLTPSNSWSQLGHRGFSNSDQKLAKKQLPSHSVHGTPWPNLPKGSSKNACPKGIHSMLSLEINLLAPRLLLQLLCRMWPTWATLKFDPAVSRWWGSSYFLYIFLKKIDIGMSIQDNFGSKADIITTTIV